MTRISIVTRLESRRRLSGHHADTFLFRNIRRGGMLWIRRLNGRDFQAWLTHADGSVTRDLSVDEVLDVLRTPEFTWHRGPARTLWIGLDEVPPPAPLWTPEDELARQATFSKRRGGPPVTRYEGASISLPPLGSRVRQTTIADALGAPVQKIRHWVGRQGVGSAGKGYVRVNEGLVDELERRGVTVTVAEGEHA